MNPPVVLLQLSLPKSDHRMFAGACRLLARLMGRKAPDPARLILHLLAHRDATGLAEDYLESIRWPVKKGFVVTLRRRNLSPLRSGRRLLLQRPSRRFPFDPSRN